MAKVRFSINSARPCSPPLSLASRPWNQGTKSLTEEVIVLEAGVDERKERIDLGFRLGTLALLSCNVAIIVANFEIEEYLGGNRIWLKNKTVNAYISRLGNELRKGKRKILIEEQHCEKTVRESGEFGLSEEGSFRLERRENVVRSEFLTEKLGRFVNLRHSLTVRTSRGVVRSKEEQGRVVRSENRY